ncbi:MAG: aspartate--tRNA(Asn) ligase [Chloroflexi bacterium HGW-Chloroflexi-4]|jgi:aspartyl-tRNA synthetase|nr:MAG: aspartate--tRNA(Asn) ligase [Chloroflexi bacterium HGW-Chloroflexi-4]
MERTLIKDLRSKIDQTVELKGWLQVLRDQKKIQFIILRDPTGAAQIAHWKPNNEALAEEIAKLGTESALTVTGKVIDNPVVKLNGLEIQLETLTVNNNAESPLPFDPFAETLPTIDYRQDWRYMDLRRPVNNLFFQVETLVELAMREYWTKNNFIEIHTPKLVGAPSESGAELFSLDYFERKAYLAQSPQFYKQMAMASGFERIFEIGPVFRADPSFTSRHMTEFTGVDMEMSWIDSHEDVMASEEQWLNYVYTRVKEQYGDAIKEQFGIDLVVPTLPFPRIPMKEAVEILKGRGWVPADKKGDIDPAGEREIAAYVKEKYNHDFVFLTDWPIGVRPFYHMRKPEDQTLTRSFDLIACGLEITTGAQREHRVEVLQKQATEKGLHFEPIQFYLDFFRYGCPPHGGFGLGLARLMMVMLGVGNIRESVYLFRGPTRLIP